MAFASSAFTRIGGAGSHQLFIYYTADVLSGGAGVDVTESGYFDDVIDDLNVNDVILAVADTGGTDVMAILIVTSVTTHVTVSTNVTQT